MLTARAWQPGGHVDVAEPEGEKTRKPSVWHIMQGGKRPRDNRNVVPSLHLLLKSQVGARLSVETVAEETVEGTLVSVDEKMKYAACSPSSSFPPHGHP